MPKSKVKVEAKLLPKMPNETSFAALPVRQRGTLEIIDTAMKLYRRYFGVLMGWSALVAVLFVMSSMVPFGALLVYPLVAGSGCCAIAAAVRGQNIAFGQVWDFTKPRYGALMLITFLSSLLMMVAVVVLFIASTLISVAGVFLLGAINAPNEVSIVVGIIGSVVATLVISVLSVYAYAWLGLIPIIACLEDDKRSTAAIGRAWDLMKGNWKRVLGLATLLSIAVAAVMGIVGGSMALYGQGAGLFTDDISESAILGLGLTFSAFIGLFFLFWNPIQTLVLAVLYLDLRVRKEALDLEWNSYSSAPPLPISEPELSAVDVSNPAPPEISPASMSGYAPGDSAPAAQPARPPQAATAPDSTAPTPPQIRPPMPATSASMPEVAPADLMASQTSSNPSNVSLDAPDAILTAPQSTLNAPNVNLTATDINTTNTNLNSPPSEATEPPIALTKETSSFAPTPNAPAPSAPDSFDFSSSFNPGASSFAPDNSPEQSSTDETNAREGA